VPVEEPPAPAPVPPPASEARDGVLGAAVAASTSVPAPTALPFPLRPIADGGAASAGRFLCSQGTCGCFTHFYAATKYAVDFSCPVGTPVLAVGDGTITEVKDTTAVGGIHAAHLFEWNSVMLKLAREPPVFVEYVHIRRGSSRVRVGDVVREGDVICESGDVGFCPTPHLHIQIHHSDVEDAPTAPFCIRCTPPGEAPTTYVPRAGVWYNPTAGPVS
jgi:murein DD-endopeptidase MepM/ murein hydrolase activator NlpD